MTFCKTAYMDNANLAVMIFDNDGSLYGRLTVNISQLPPDEAAVDTNNIPDAEQMIAANQLGCPTGKYLQSGFCTYPVYKFDLEKLGSF